MTKMAVLGRGSMRDKQKVRTLLRILVNWNQITCVENANHTLPNL